VHATDNTHAATGAKGHLFITGPSPSEALPSPAGRLLFGTASRGDGWTTEYKQIFGKLCNRFRAKEVTFLLKHAKRDPEAFQNPFNLSYTL